MLGTKIPDKVPSKVLLGLMFTLLGSVIILGYQFNLDSKLEAK